MKIIYLLIVLFLNVLFPVFGFAQVHQTSKVVNGGIINGKARILPKPEYPSAAFVVHASGAVNVRVTIDEEGNIISAEATSGHPLLRSASVEAA